MKPYAAFHGVTPLPAIRDKRTLTGWVTPATANNSPASAGLLIWKGCDMKKYYPVDFDEKGNAVLGNAKSNPTSNGFIPTTWVPGGGSEEEGDGVKSVSISPAITTTPALESLFPVYYEDLTDAQKQDGVTITANYGTLQGQYTVTIIPTSNWYIADGETMEFQGKGEPITMEMDASEGFYKDVILSNGTTQETSTQYFSATLSFSED